MVRIVTRAEQSMAAISVVALLTMVLVGAVMARSLARKAEMAVQAVERMARGDLTVQLQAQGENELDRIMRALNRMAQRLRETLAEVRQASSQISVASQEVAVGASDLSVRTEQTAGNLEKTASSMEQITTMVRQASDSAQHANQLALTAATVAQQGGEVVSRVVETMNGINQSSTRISDIISVIDGIAFQTNILALNAAVEAARAGEQGRGFAVVAGEVRNLAQRSAEAAKEIKALITESVTRVEAGTSLVHEAGETIRGVVSHSRQVSDIVAELMASSAEQAQGIGQVNEAVSLLDQMTQQNAALVEESSAAAESLQEQAHRLDAQVAVFDIGQHAAKCSAAFTRTPTPRLDLDEPTAARRAAPLSALPKAAQASNATAVVAASSTAGKDEGDWTSF